MRDKSIFWSIVVALSGFLFGFDTVVISGANLPIKELWGLSPLNHGMFIMSMALWGTVIGALASGRPIEKYGRKTSLFVIGLLYLISALGSAVAPDPYSFSFFRFIGGLGVGASSVAAPAYISEISSAAVRGRRVALYQFNIVFGIFVAFISNYLLQGVGGGLDWRLMLGAEAIPALVFCILIRMVPQSPRWLALQEEKTGTDRIDSDVTTENKNTRAGLFQHDLRKPLMLAFLIAFFNQWSGINFILYYAPEIMDISGLASKESLWSSIFIGLVNLVFTVLGINLIDRLGRRQLLILGSIGYILSLFAVAYGFKQDLSSTYLLVFLCLFIASHAIGQGAVIWVFISEIFPTAYRARGQAFGSGVHWVLAAFITLITPVFLDGDKGIFKDNPWPIFAFLGGLMVVQLIWVLLKVPETKGIELEEIQQTM